MMMTTTTRESQESESGGVASARIPVFGLERSQMFVVCGWLVMNASPSLTQTHTHANRGKEVR